MLEFNGEKVIKNFSILEKVLQLGDSKIGKTFHELSRILNISEEDMIEYLEWFEKYSIIFKKSLSDEEKQRMLNSSMHDINKLKKKHSLLKNIHDGKTPRTLYKYRSFNHFFEMLESNEMWLNGVNDFNDAFEGINPVPDNVSEDDIKEYKKHLIKRFPQVNSANQPNFDDIIRSGEFKKIMQEGLKKIKIGCFTIYPTNKIMWGLYSDSYRGVCMEFDIIQDLDFFDFILPVTYTNEYPELNYFKNPSKFPVKGVYFTKSEEWDYEKEFRLLKYNRSGNLYPFNKQSLKSIIFGINTKEDDILKTDEILNKYEYNVKLKKAVKAKNKFEIEIEDI